MIKLYDGIYIDDNTIRISRNIASHYVPYVVLEYLPRFGGYYYFKEEVAIFFCPMLAVKFIDTLYANSACSYKLEQLQVHLDYVLLNMKHCYPQFMFSDETVAFKEFRKKCSTSLFCSQTNIDDYFK